MAMSMEKGHAIIRSRDMYKPCVTGEDDIFSLDWGHCLGSAILIPCYHRPLVLC